MSPEEREQLAADYTFRRIVELQLDPVEGNFDAQHLKEINRRIFQDLPDLGYTDIRPGDYRDTVAQGNDWIKRRELATVGGVFCVAYSRMDDEALDRLDEVLESLDVDALSELNTEQFGQRLADLYLELDYIHPFIDGNSRTLRSFTGQLADEAGYDLDWGYFNQTPLERDLLYVARDLGVNALALPSIQGDKTLRSVLQSMDQLRGNRELSELMTEAIRPYRAIAFEDMEEADALELYPELAVAYQELHDAEDYFIREGKQDSEEARAQAMDAVAAQIQEQLDQGKIQDFDLDLELEDLYKNLTSVQEVKHRL